MIFAVDGIVQSHDIFHALRGVMQESIGRVGDAQRMVRESVFLSQVIPFTEQKKKNISYMRIIIRG